MVQDMEVRAQSLIDPLTGLHNRRGFFVLAEQQLRLAQRGRLGMLLLFADVDDLKGINDRAGHAAGDRALQAVAIVLRETFPESDILARLGGDEFVVLAIGAILDSLSSPSYNLRCLPWEACFKPAGRYYFVIWST